MSDPEEAAGATNTMSEPGTDASGAGSEDASARDDAGEELLRALDRLRVIGRDVVDLLDVTLEKARLGARARASRLVVLAWLAVGFAAATVFAAYFVIEGVTGAMSELLGGRLWAGRLAGGVLVLALLGTAWAMLRGRARRANLRRLRDKYENHGSAEGR